MKRDTFSLHGCSMWLSGWFYGLIAAAFYSQSWVVLAMCVALSLAFGLAANHVAPELNSGNVE